MLEQLHQAQPAGVLEGEDLGVLFGIDLVAEHDDGPASGEGGPPPTHRPQRVRSPSGPPRRDAFRWSFGA